MVDVFFSGYGNWCLNQSNEYAEYVSFKEEEKGFFKLSEVDGLSYTYTKDLTRVNKLLPCDRPNSAFLRMVQEGKLSKEDIDRCYFEICKYETVYPPVEKDIVGRAVNPIEQQKSLMSPKWQKVDYELIVVEPEKSNNIESKTDNMLMPPTYLDSKHPMFSEELSIAIQAWNEVLECNPDKPKTGSRKQLVEVWLETYNPTLTKQAKNRIATLLNPDKNGGAPSSD